MKHLGKVVKVHVSNMCETDLGFRAPKGEKGALGAHLVQERSRKFFVTKEEYEELFADNKKPQKDVKKFKAPAALRKQADELGVPYVHETSKEDLQTAIDAKLQEQLEENENELKAEGE